jgi:hypothetical protein
VTHSAFSKGAVKLNPYLLKSTVVAAIGGLLFGFGTAVIAGTTHKHHTTYFGLPGLAGRLFQEIVTKYPQKTAVIALGSPYLIESFPQIQTYICTYAMAPTSEISAVKALFGEVQNHAKLPVTLPGIAPLGFSLPWPTTESRVDTTPREPHIPDCLGQVSWRASKSAVSSDSCFVRDSKWLGAELGARFAREKRWFGPEATPNQRHVDFVLLFRDQEVEGSNPFAPTIFLN